MEGGVSIVLDLCGGTGAWSRPYAEAGYDVCIVDIANGFDVRRFKAPKRVRGVLAAPPCTEFAVSGARWWAGKPPGALWEALGVVTACLEVVRRTRPRWWALENPVGRLSRYIGPWRYTFQPWEYGDAWFKRTCIWGSHNVPEKCPVEPGSGSMRADWIHRLPPGPDRAALRAVTPPGYARAFMEANP
jgi:hypothetical protein